MPQSTAEPHGPSKSTLKLAFASIGVVFGDIGTSPLYAMREALHPVVSAGGDLRAAVIGVASLLIWALILIVTLKYVVFLMKADNKGEGGILSLVVLVETLLNRKGGIVLALGMIGAAFFFGDAMITPAMSVLSAVEGLKVVNEGFTPYIVPLTLAILVSLFLFQYKGTAGVASLFAPVTFVWFFTLGVMGIVHIFDDLEIFHAFNPAYGLSMLVERPGLALLVFGGVFLAVTGGEALYADMGHFGSKPIRIAWLSVVFPGLILNYLGQGAFIISHPESVVNPFFLMVDGWMVIPLVILATAVTVIASQAVITGAFSIAQQAMSLGLFPRMSITHTSETEHGQIYVAQINWMLLVGVVMLVIVFRSSGNLASAYGIAVNTSMVIELDPRRHLLLEGAHAAALVRDPRDRADLRHRGGVPRGQWTEARPWRVCTRPARRLDHSPHVHLDARAPGAGGEAAQGIGRARTASRKPGAPPAHTGCGCSRVPPDRPRLCAECADAQPETQPRAA